MPDERVLTAPKGTNDLVPPESQRWVQGLRCALDTFAGSGYQLIETPMFEHTEVFLRGVGETTEVVSKQMYTFLDEGGRSLTLRPEGTAPVIRAVLEHNLHRANLPLKLSYGSFMFRRERPQKGRFRQFFQVGIEAIGSENAAIDAEVVEIGSRFLSRMGVEFRVLLNSVGHRSPVCRDGYVVHLQSWLSDHVEALAPIDRKRFGSNPLRIFDSKEHSTREVMRHAPLIVDHLCPDCRGHFNRVQALLKSVGVEFQLEPRLVRGLDYYSRTAFEFDSPNLGSQSAVGGGGRYDGLSELLGGPRLPAIGFALGLDRILLARDNPHEPDPSAIDVYLVTEDEETFERAFGLASAWRSSEIGVELDFLGRRMKTQMKEASRLRARWAVILRQEEPTNAAAILRNLLTGDEELLPLPVIEQRIREGNSKP